MSDDELWYAGIDDGYADTKVAVMGPGLEKPMTFKFPSLVSDRITERAVNAGESSDIYLTGGNQYSVVQNHANARDIRRIDYPGSPENRVLIHHALRRAGLGGRKVRIVTGLPVNQYFGSDAGINEVRCEKKKAGVAQLTRAGERDVALAEIVDHEVTSEALAAALDSMSSFAGGFDRTEPGQWAVVDIGGHTTDCLGLINRGMNMKVDNGRRFTIEWGVLKAEDLVRERVAQEKDENPDSLNVRGCLTTRCIEFFGKPLDVGIHCDEAVKVVGRKIIDSLMEKLGSGAALQEIIFIGGGARVFASVSRQYHRNALVPDDPEFANARGMLKLAMYG